MAVLLLLGAIGADAAGEHALSFYLVLGGVVTTAHASLQAYGRVVELPGNAPAATAARVQSVLGACALALVLVAAAVRAPAVADGVVPALGLSALVASLALLVLETAVRLVQR
jgi:hypothetical protein